MVGFLPFLKGIPSCRLNRAGREVEVVHAELEGYPPEGKSRGKRREDERGSIGRESGTGWEVVRGVRVVRRRTRVVSMLLEVDENMVGWL